MSKSFYFISLSVTMGCLLLLGCSSKGEKIKKNIDMDNPQTEYVLIESLSSDDYSSSSGYFPKDGFVPTPETAVQIAEIVLSEIYGKKNIESQKPFVIKLENDVWLLEGQIEERKGGVAYIEIRKSNGQILKVVHGK